jgi:hypothetical protein
MKRPDLTNAQSRKRATPQHTAGEVSHRFSLRVLGLVVLATGLAVALAPPASSASVPCWQRVIADWSKHGSFAGTYPPSCLRQAMQNEPTDLRVYSTLDESLQQALTLKSRTARRLALAVTPTPVASLDGGSGPPSQLLLVFIVGSLGLLITASAIAAGRLMPRAAGAGPPPASRRGATRSDHVAIKLAATAGFLVTDRSGKTVGRVESPMYGTTPDEPDALAVKAGLFQRSLVMAYTIDSIDEAKGVIVLSCERNSIPTFL